MGVGETPYVQVSLGALSKPTPHRNGGEDTLTGGQQSTNLPEKNMSRNLNSTWVTNVRDARVHVRRLQRRIFKAALRDDLRTVRALQQRLIRSDHAKHLAVHQVTTRNRGVRSPGVDGVVLTTPNQKQTLAKNLRIDGKAAPIRRVSIPKPGIPAVRKTRPNGIPTVQDRAKQALAKFALEPEWEARFEPNAYGFRPGRCVHDAIEAIRSNLHHGVDKMVYDADIRACFDTIDHAALLRKLNTFPLMARQVRAWLQADIMGEFEAIPRDHQAGTPVGGIISPLLANIALHGLETHLKSRDAERSMPKPHPGAANGCRAKRSALGVVRYADELVLIHRNPEILAVMIQETRSWLATVGLTISEEKSRVRWTSQGFRFLGFQVITVRRRGRFRVKITPSKEAVSRLTQKTHAIIVRRRTASAYDLIQTLRPVLIGWANYYRYCECSVAFSRVDNVVYQQLRAWTLRRAVRKGRKATMQTYFPHDRTYVARGRIHRSSWVFSGVRCGHRGLPERNYLSKISWIASESWVKVQGTNSVYDGNRSYWTDRSQRHGSLSPRVNDLYTRQKGRCAWCNQAFIVGEPTDVDHVIPQSRGGSHRKTNLQLLHRACHILKSRNDDLQEPDDGKLSRPVLKTR